jgi:hypothetical protein
MYLLMPPGNFTVQACSYAGEFLPKSSGPGWSTFPKSLCDFFFHIIAKVKSRDFLKNRPGWSTIDVTGPLLVNFSRVLFRMKDTSPSVPTSCR